MISHCVSVMTQKRTVVMYHGVHDERSEPKRFYKISRAQRVGVFSPCFRVHPCSSVGGNISPCPTGQKSKLSKPNYCVLSWDSLDLSSVASRR